MPYFLAEHTISLIDRFHEKQEPFFWADQIRCYYAFTSLIDAQAGSGPDELYDRAGDPWETLHVIDHPGYREAGRLLRARLLSWMEETRDPAHSIYNHNKVGYYDRGSQACCP